MLFESVNHKAPSDPSAIATGDSLVVTGGYWVTAPEVVIRAMYPGTVVNLPIGSACTVKPLYRYFVSHTAPPPVLPYACYRLITVLAVSNTPFPAVLCGSPHPRDYLFSYCRVSPPFLGHNRPLLTHDRIGESRPYIGDYFFARCRISPSRLCGFT